MTKIILKKKQKKTRNISRWISMWSWHSFTKEKSTSYSITVLNVNWFLIVPAALKALFTNLMQISNLLKHLPDGLDAII